MIVGQILVIFLLVAANGFFVASEFALVKVRASQIAPLAKAGRRTAMLAESMIEHVDRYLSACQLGITMASLALGWLAAPVVASWLEPPLQMIGLPATFAWEVAFVIAFFLLVLVHLGLGEQAPKVISIRSATVVMLTVAWPLQAFTWLLSPILWTVDRFSAVLIRALGISPVSSREQTLTEEELRIILADTAAGGHVTLSERRLMENALNLEEKTARQVMVPRSDIVYLSNMFTLEENLQIVAESGHSRFPLCADDLDHVLGMVHAKTLLQSMILRPKIQSLAEVSQSVPSLSENLRLDHLLREFLRSRRHLAMLIDEYGGVTGMVTFEQVLEELVGPIQDEFDHEAPQVVVGGDGRWLVDAMCPVDELADQCGVDLPDDVEADTTGGLVIELLGRIPQPGETVQLGQHQLKVLEATPTRVRRVEIQQRANEADNGRVA